MDLNSINLACESLQTAHPLGLHTVVFSAVVTLPEEHSVADNNEAAWGHIASFEGG